MGHTGTLDPFATGLLVVLLGRATRIAQFVPTEPKTYEAAISFGHETTTDDALGEMRCESGAPDMGRIATGIEQLTGDIQQLPPEYSAKKVGGTRAYAAARRGAPLQLQPVCVHVFGWSIQRFVEGTLYATISCGSGTYVRALARDLGRLTGSAAHLSALRRTRAGPFDVAEATTMDALTGGAFAVRPAHEALANLPFERLTEEAERAVRHGRAIPAQVAGDRAALLDQQGRLLAIANRKSELWQPSVVLVDA